jgi:hypothetical protein
VPQRTFGKTISRRISAHRDIRSCSVPFALTSSKQGEACPSCRQTTAQAPGIPHGLQV